MKNTPEFREKTSDLEDKTNVSINNEVDVHLTHPKIGDTGKKKIKLSLSSDTATLSKKEALALSKILTKLADEL